MANGTTQSDSRSFSQLWKENHGNLLVGVLAIILLVGFAVLLWPKYQQPKDPFLIPGVKLADEGAEESLAQDDTEIGSSTDMSLLLIKIIGLKSDRGVVRIAMYNDPLTFNDPAAAFEKVAVQINGTEASWEVKVPANSPVAIAAYHDQNENDQLDKSLIGIPTEKYGFSLGERSPRGPPKFEEAAFLPEPGIVEVPIQVW